MRTTFEKYLVRHLNQMVDILHLRHFHIFLSFVDENIMAKVAVDYRYLEATIWVGKRLRESYNSKKFYIVQLTLIHELCHIITGERLQPLRSSLKPFSRHFDEKVNEQVARIAMMAYERRKK